MKKYKTGECYSEFCIKNEISVMNFSKNCADIFILKKSPDKNLIDKITNTNPFFQIYTKNNIIFLLLQFENLDWIDIPYIHKGKMPDIIKDETLGYLCKIFFIDTVTGKVLAKRHSCFSNGLSKAFYYALLEQKNHLPKNILEKINSIRASFHPNEIARLSLGK